VLCVLNLGPPWITLPLLSPAPPLARRLSAANEPAFEREAREMGREAGRDHGDPAAFDDAATALTLSILEVVSPEVDPAPSDASDEIAQLGSQVADPGPGIASAWAFLNLSRWLPLLALAYAAASAFLLGRWFLGHCALWRLLRNAQPAPEPIYQLF